MLSQVNTIISDQCRDKGVEYECRVNGALDDYYIGDEMKLRQVMINILGNAVKFTPPGGIVTFVVETIARFNGKSTLRFIISDTGIGMSKEFIPRLFDAFSQEDSSSTNRFGSTGLGMAITKSIIELMNGTISVENEKHKGTTFTVTVTLIDSDRKSIGEEEAVLHPHELCVLVIDDDPIACEHAQLVLGQVGVSCEKALSGAEGVQMVKVRHARREPYNLILVDLRMPDMDGVETTRQIRASVGDETPVIILTSYNWDEIEDEAKAAGVDTFVAKPLIAGKVLDEFREAFTRKNTPIIALTANAFDDDVKRSMQAGLNAHLSKPVEPEVLFETLEALLHQ